MLNCTDTVYILLLHSGLHLLHAPFRPKITFYGLLLALETKKKTGALLIIVQDALVLGKLEKYTIVYPYITLRNCLCIRWEI